ncbi:hypothetical protein NDU88_002200 [Pleurodeles waltl]|uniref:Uncharacterized protein n=1 Tax=Pleurodeles waltl TaxID=8319 RepID=A0AAV7LDI2_PLEWA|nr:hypothetical protein NDU88_002200 [Pleurodeles waltl]
MSQDRVGGASALTPLADLSSNESSFLSPVPQKDNEGNGGVDGKQEVLHSSAELGIVNTVHLSDTQSQIIIPEPNALENMITSLTDSIKKGFAISGENQVEIRSACESLEKKIDLLVFRTQALEESVKTLSENVERNKEEIQLLKRTERDLQDKMEILENNSRRNNLRIFNIPVGMEWSDLKKYIATLIKKAVPTDASEAEILNDIHRVHQDLFRRNPNIKKPQLILVNFKSYLLKKKILTKALELGSLDSGETKFEIRSDLSRTTLNRQWELGKRLEEFKELGAEVRLRVPANLRVMLNDKMYNIRDPVAADDLIDAIKKGNIV